MTRTEQAFAKAITDLKSFISRHNKPVWLVPTQAGYSVSVVKPDSSQLPYGTASNLYDKDLNIVSTVRSLKQP